MPQWISLIIPGLVCCSRHIQQKVLTISLNIKLPPLFK